MGSNLIMDKTSKITVTGGNGFLGKFVVEELWQRGYKNIFIPHSAYLDLRVADNCQRAVRGADIVIHLAGNVGGIGYNRENPATLFYDNILMGVNLIHESYLAKVKKFVCISTICAYPKITPIPFKEENLWNGYPEETNASYGLAKKVLLPMLQAYRQQHGFNGIYLLPVNLYGPGDSGFFDEKKAHVIPDLIRKLSGDNVELWGDGTPTREFLYVKDAARGIVDAMEKYDKAEPVNLGAGFEISIKDLADLIAKKLDLKGKITWNTDKPNGQPRRCLDVSKAEQEFGFKAKTTFDEGLNETIKWIQTQKYQ